MADYEDVKVTDLVINNISQEKYDELKTAGLLDETQIYLTPTEESGGGDYLPLSGGTLEPAATIGFVRYTGATVHTLSVSSVNALSTSDAFQCGKLYPKTPKNTDIGEGVYRWRTIYVTKMNNGADLDVPTEGGTLARIEDIQGIVSVLPTVDNGYTTVKNFGNGYVEITGYASIGTVGAGTGSEVQIDLPSGYTMADANYWVNIAPTSETTMFDFKAEAKARSTTHFMVAYKNEDDATGLTAAGVYWEVRGMLASTES